MSSETATFPIAEPVFSATSKPERLVSLDVFRGLIIAGMILVTDPGTYSRVYWPLLHKDWNGWTPTDMIFPSFLFIVGVAITLSFRSRTARGETRGKLTRHLLRRSAVLIFLGLILNGFPFFDLHRLRIPGVLQRIALCYLCGGLLYLATGKSLSTAKRVYVIGGVTAGLIAGYWAILKLVPVPGFGAGRLDSLGNLGAYIDRAVFTTRHMWPYGTTPGVGVTYDPEGLLSTLGALVNLLVGILAGEWLRSKNSGTKKAAGFAVAGLILLAAGIALNPLLPINKRIWTSTFALFSCGFSLVTFAVCYWVVDLGRLRGWAMPVLVLGTNAIFAYALSNIITPITDVVHVHTANEALTLHEWGYQTLFLPWLSPINASLAYAILIVLINIAIVYPLYRKRIFLRV